MYEDRGESSQVCLPSIHFAPMIASLLLSRLSVSRVHIDAFELQLVRHLGLCLLLMCRRSLTVLGGSDRAGWRSTRIMGRPRQRACPQFIWSLWPDLRSSRLFLSLFHQCIIVVVLRRACLRLSWRLPPRFRSSLLFLCIPQFLSLRANHCFVAVGSKVGGVPSVHMC